MFPQELMLLARALVHLEATAAVIDPDLGLADLLDPLLPELRSKLLPGTAELEQLWSSAAMDYLALATELPAALPHLLDRLIATTASHLPQPPHEPVAPVAPRPSRAGRRHS